MHYPFSQVIHLSVEIPHKDKEKRTRVGIELHSNTDISLKKYKCYTANVWKKYSFSYKMMDLQK